MALRWIEGFEVARGDTQLARKWGSSSGGIGGGPARIPGLGASGSDTSADVRIAGGTLTPQDTWIVQFGWRINDLLNSTEDGGYVLLDSVVGEQIRLLAAQFGDVGDARWRIQIKRGSTLLAQTGPLWTGQTYYVQFKVTVDPVNGAYELKIDGATVLSDAGPVNTAEGAVAGADRHNWRWFHAGGTSAQFDDIVVMDDTGATFNDFITSKLVLAIRPTGDLTTDWNTSAGGTHYLLVDDPAGTPEDTNFVLSQTLTDIDLWEYGAFPELANLSATPVVVAVMVETVYSLQGSGSRTFAPRFRNGLTTPFNQVNGVNVVITDNVIRYTQQIWENNPDTAAAWTIAELEAAQFGVQLIA